MSEPLPPPTLEHQRDHWRQMFVDMRRYRDAYREDLHRAEAALAEYLRTDELDVARHEQRALQADATLATVRTLAREHVEHADGCGLLAGQILAALDTPAPTYGDVAKCPQCGKQSRSYSRGCSNCGYGVPDSTDPPAARTSVPLKDLIEEESARSPEFAAEVERWNRTLDADCHCADAERPVVYPDGAFLGDAVACARFCPRTEDGCDHDGLTCDAWDAAQWAAVAAQLRAHDPYAAPDPVEATPEEGA